MPLSQREFLYLQDYQKLEDMAIQKFGAYARQVGDPELKRQLEDIQRMHQRHYDTITRHLGATRTLQ